MSRYTRIDSGLDDRGRPWQVGLSNRVDGPPTLVVTVPEGTAALYFNGDERDRFAHAVARALKPIPAPRPKRPSPSDPRADRRAPIERNH